MYLSGHLALPSAGTDHSRKMNLVTLPTNLFRIFPRSPASLHLTTHPITKTSNALTSDRLPACRIFLKLRRQESKQCRGDWLHFEGRAAAGHILKVLRRSRITKLSQEQDRCQRISHRSLCLRNCLCGHHPRNLHGAAGGQLRESWTRFKRLSNSSVTTTFSWTCCHNCELNFSSPLVYSRCWTYACLHSNWESQHLTSCRFLVKGWRVAFVFVSFLMCCPSSDMYHSFESKKHSL